MLVTLWIVLPLILVFLIVFILVILFLIFLSYNHLSPIFSTYVTFLSSIPVPTSVAEALARPGWRHAMENEMMALIENHTWQLAFLPEGKQPVGYRWVFIIKVHPNGTLH